MEKDDSSKISIMFESLSGLEEELDLIEVDFSKENPTFILENNRKVVEFGNGGFKEIDS